ncbi:hypothetical protein C8R43DRAFT_1021367, partial [Mycena crocata]
MPPCFCLENVLLSLPIFFVPLTLVHAASSKLWQIQHCHSIFWSLPADDFPFLAKNANKARELPYLAHVIRAESGQL